MMGSAVEEDPQSTRHRWTGPAWRSTSVHRSPLLLPHHRRSRAEAAVRATRTPTLFLLLNSTPFDSQS